MTKTDFFKKYPSSPGYYQVGNKQFLLHAKLQAETEARNTGKELEFITKPKKAAKNG